MGGEGAGSGFWIPREKKQWAAAGGSNVVRVFSLRGTWQFGVALPRASPRIGAPRAGI